MQFFNIPPLDSIYYVPPHRELSEAKSGAAMAMHVLLWTPQVIWALLAALALFKIVINRKKGVRQLLPVLPYTMVLLVVAFAWNFSEAEFGPVLRTRDDNMQYFTSQVSNRIMFEDTAFPSLYALPILFIIHLVAFAARSNEGDTVSG